MKKIITPLSVSISVHIVLIAIVGFVFNELRSHTYSLYPDNYIELTTKVIENDNVNIIEKTDETKTVKLKKKKKSRRNTGPLKDKSKLIRYNAGYYVSFNDFNMETSSLEQYYSDPTNNITLRYPTGWTFLDNYVQGKLKGVTFWDISAHSSPPPFVHLKIVDKQNFKPNRFLYSKVFVKFTAYFNDPKISNNKIEQKIYLRTDTGCRYDIIIDLVVKDGKEFKDLQPKFFGMIGTLKVGEHIL